MPGIRAWADPLVVWHAGAVETFDLDTHVSEWLTLGQAAELLGIEVAGVRRLIADAELVCVRRGTPAERSVPRELVDPDLVPGLAGTVTLLRDCGCSDEELLDWLLTPDSDDGQSPLHLLRIGHRTEARRRAQMLAF